MTPEPALWNWRSCGFESGGTSKKRRKNGSSSKGFRCPGSSLIVPRVAILTTAAETRLTMGASEGIGAASAMDAGSAAFAGPETMIAGPAMTAAASVAAASLRRRFMRSPSVRFVLGVNRGRTFPSGLIDANTIRYYTEECAGRSLLGGFHRDPARLHLRQFRNCDFQHTVDELRLDVLGVGRIRQAETALEFARDALYAAVALAGFLARVLALSTNGEHTLIGGDFHRFWIPTRQIHLQGGLVCLLPGVHPRRPVARNFGR